MKLRQIIALPLLSLALVTVNLTPVSAATCPVGIIHRGFVQTGIAENTVNAFNNAFNQGFQWVETDTYFTSDGHPVLFHNPTVDGTTNGKGAIASMTLAQFKALKYKNGQSTSSLADALPLFNATGKHLLLEIKLALTVAQQQTLISMLTGYESSIHLTGFAPTFNTLVAIKQLQPSIDISYLAHDAKNNLPSSFSAKNIEYTKINALSVLALHNSGFQVRAWTPNAVSNWRSLKLASVDAIITDKAIEYKNWVAAGCQ